MTIENLTSELRQDYNIADNVEGVLVASVNQESSAATTLEEGDVIIQINRKPVGSVSEAIAAVKGSSGDSVLFKILRSGHAKLVIVKK